MPNRIYCCCCTHVRVLCACVRECARANSQAHFNIISTLSFDEFTKTFKRLSEFGLKFTHTKNLYTIQTNPTFHQEKFGRITMKCDGSTCHKTHTSEQTWTWVLNDKPVWTPGKNSWGCVFFMPDVSPQILRSPPPPKKKKERKKKKK